LIQRQVGVDSQLVMSKYSYCKTHKNKSSSNGLMTAD